MKTVIVPNKVTATKKPFPLGTLFYYSALAAVFLGIVYSNDFLLTIGLIITVPVISLIFIGSALLEKEQRDIAEHPERYSVTLFEDEDGNIINTKWTRK